MLFDGMKSNEVLVQLKKYNSIDLENFKKCFVYEAIKLQVMQGLLPQSYLTRINKKQICFETAWKKAESLVPQMVNGIHWKKIADNKYVIGITVFATEHKVAI